jgi:peptide deformylase
MQIEDLTYIKNEEDLPFLRNKLFDVNIRLYNNSVIYKELIRYCCKIIAEYCLTKLKGYSKPFGMSGANLGIPFNIIAKIVNRNTAQEKVDILINPIILDKKGKQVETLSNCGSIRLESPIKILRHELILVGFYTIEGNYSEKWFDRKEGSFTIQHEVGHNNGILITDY